MVLYLVFVFFRVTFETKQTYKLISNGTFCYANMLKEGTL